MPQHDLPDGHETESNLIDFRKYLRQRVALSEQDDHPPEAEPTDLEIYRHAEHGDGKRPKFGRYDVMWLGMILALGWMLWLLVFH